MDGAGGWGQERGAAALSDDVTVSPCSVTPAFPHGRGFAACLLCSAQLPGVGIGLEHPHPCLGGAGQAPIAPPESLVTRVMSKFTPCGQLIIQRCRARSSGN